MQLHGLDFRGGGRGVGNRGCVSWPARSGDPRQRGRDDRAFNALYGNRVEGGSAAEQDELAAENLAIAARAAKRVEGTVLVEPVSGAPRYPQIGSTAIDRVGEDNVRLLLDVYHLAVNGDDVDAAIDIADQMGTSIADAPSRHQPGTGELPIAGWIEKIFATGYDGWVACEYNPEGPHRGVLRWLEGLR